jgi:Carboxypeptidase regulatory-like domain
MNSRGFLKSLVLLAALLAAAGIMLVGTAPSAMAQTASQGALTGMVTDQQGAVIPGAEIRIQNTGTGSFIGTLSNAEGRYTIPNVQPGTYDVTIKKQGFTTAKFSNQVVEVGQQLTLDVPMAVGATTTTVEVQATGAAELQTLNATVGSTVSSDSMQMLPNLSRDASYLAVLQVGVSLDGNVAGAATDQNKFQLDGGNNSDDMAGGNATYTPANGYAGTAGTGGTPTGVMPTPVESIEEFKVGTTGQDASFGSSAGSQVQMVTKRGTNSYHGAIYEYYFSTDVGAANTWKNNHTADAATGTLDTPLPSAHRNRYGGALGGPIFPKAFLGGKWYFFTNYEAMNFPNNQTFERASPTAAFRAGVITMPNTAGVETAYNINSNPVTVNGVTYPGCGSTGSCDPRGLGANPVIQKIWNTMPLPNDLTDTANDPYGNSGGYLAPLSIPQTSKFIVGRIDHDFNDKNRFFVSYRYYDFNQLSSVQTDMGGVLPGATAGQYTAYGVRPQKPGYWVTGLTTTISPNMTNDIHFSYLRNYWNWQDQAGPPQFAGLGAVVEPGGESQNALLPYNVDSQDTRQRYWRGHDYFLNDQISNLHGNHLIQFGGTYQRNHDIHGRNDNGVGIDTSPAYIAGSPTLGTGISSSAYTLPAGAASSDLSNYQVLFDEVAGVITQTQVMYTRSGSQLTLNPLGTPGFDDSIIPSYNLYATDTWHVKPHVTITYGLTYDLSMPPYEVNGKQVEMVDSAGNPIGLKAYLTEKEQAALNGGVFQPQIGFDLIGNAAGGQNKYPYSPFYGGFSPHASIAWNPTFNGGLGEKIFGRNNTVLRGGYGRIYGRLNGVDLMLVPLLGPGLLQAVACVGPTNPAAGSACTGPGGANLLTAFRIGADGLTAPLPTVSQTFPQPFVPGTVQIGSALNAAAADGSQLDPNLRPNHSDEVTLTLQRSFSPKLLLEVGYIGRKISNEFQEVNIDALPTMTTLGGQTFAQAYANVYTEYCGLQGVSAAGVSCLKNSAAVTNQPFFEAALGGPTSAYCAVLDSCTKSVVAAEGSNIATTNVYSLWTDIAKSPSYILGKSLLNQSVVGGQTLPAQLAGSFDFINSYGHGSYNAAFVTFKTTNYHGWTTQQNFTWGRALGTGSVVQASSSITVPNPFDFNNFGTYGVQPFDVKFTYNFVSFYQEPWFKDQKGLLGRVVGGWVLSPLFTARSGLPQRITCDASSTCSGQTSDQSEQYSEAVGVSPFTGGYAGEGYYNFQNASASGPGSSGNPAVNKGTGINMFNNPVQVASEFRPYVLGLDGQSGGAGVIRGFPYWNLDATLSKDFRIRENIGATLLISSVNVLNHFVPANPTTSIQSTNSFGVVTSQYASGNGVAARWMEFGLRVRF